MTGAVMELLLFFLSFFILFRESQTSSHIICGNRPLFDLQHQQQEEKVLDTDHGKLSKIDELLDRVRLRVLHLKELNVEEGEWPWIASIQQQEQNIYEHICAGTILNSQWVMTAAHCFNKLNGEDATRSLKLVFGAQHLSEHGPMTQVRYVRQIIKNEQYDPNTQNNDIALIQLNKAIQFNDRIQPACLPSSSANLEPMTECHMAGWGVHEEEKGEEPVSIMQEVKVKRIDTKDCNQTYHGTVEENNLCASQNSADVKSCQGDSAGPLMCKRKKVFTVVGIASWGSGCSQINSPGVFTSTQSFVKWMVDKVISEEMKSATKVKEFIPKIVVPVENAINDVDPSAIEEKNVEPTNRPTLKNYRKRFRIQESQKAQSIPPEFKEAKQTLEVPRQSQQAQSKQTNTALLQFINTLLKLKALILGLFQ